MARPTNVEKLSNVHEAALVGFNRVQSALREERQQCRNDRRFYSIPGAMWEGGLDEQFANKPRFEVNKVHAAVMRVINEYRNNRITVDFQAKDGETNLELADTCDGLYRSDEKDSCAEEAYDNGFEEAVGGGFGAWRLRACYEDEYDPDNERQRIRFEPIYDADTSVYFDLDSKRQNKSNAKECWVVYSKDRAAYEEEYDDDPASWPKDLTDGAFFDWATPDVVYLAEYYKVEEKSERIHIYVTADGAELRYSDDEIEEEEAQQEIALAEAIKVRERRIKKRKVHKYLMSGGGILEDQGYVAGKYIPVIPVYGKRWFVDNIERCMGVVRLSKDPQRIKNMMLSWLAETAAASGIQKPILTPEQIAGHEPMWAEDNVTNYPYLLINPLVGPDGTPVLAGPIAYTKPPDIPQALGALLQLAESDMADILGRPENAEKLVSNISADAVEMIQGRLDLQAYIYLSNFAKAMQWCGVVWLSMAKELYVEEGRKMKLIGEMGNVETVELGKEVIDEKTGEIRLQNDLTEADFDVVADVGPSFTSKREAIVRTLNQMLPNVGDPQTRMVLQSMILMNIEGEGMAEIREFFRRQLVQMGVVPPNEEERKAMDEQAGQQQQDPNAVYLLSEAEKAQQQARESQSKTELNIAKIEETQAATELKHAQAERAGAEAGRIAREPQGAE